MKTRQTLFAAVMLLAVDTAFAALPLSAAELAHSWSFNGDYSDSVGGADAVKCGTYVSLYGGKVHMGYGACSHGTGYVDLETNMLDTTAATFEKQGVDVTLVKWQRRDAATGDLLSSGSLTMKGGIGSFVNPVLYLGHSQYDSDKDALAAYDEVRLWSGVLTDAQLAASA